MAKTIVFVHGAFLTPLCWEHWRSLFEAEGYHCLAPAWPGRDRPVEALRGAQPDPELGRLTLGAVVKRYAAELAALDEKPIVIGHSIGGLVAQLLVNRAAAAAGIAIQSTPPPRRLLDEIVLSAFELEPGRPVRRLKRRRKC